MSFLNIAQAVEGLNNCASNNYFENFNNYYSTITLVILFAFFLVLIAMAFSYLFFGKKSRKFIKSYKTGRVFSFVFILFAVGWMVLQFLGVISGKDQKCPVLEDFPQQDKKVLVSDTLLSQNNKVQEEKGYYSNFYKSLDTYSDIQSFVEGKEKRGEISQTKGFDIASQTKNLKNGDYLLFSAPVRTDSLDSKEDTFIPLLTLKKEGDQIKLENIGSYWDILGQAWQKEGLINLNLDTPKTNFQLLDKNGEVLEDGKYKEALGSTLNDLKETLNLETNPGESKIDNFSEIITSSFDKNKTTEQIDDILTDIIKYTGKLYVEKQAESDLNSSAEARCTQSKIKGEWFNDECTCPKNSSLGINGSCQLDSELKNNCENSGGNFLETQSGDYEPSAVCGDSDQSSKNLFTEDSAERASLNEVIPNRSYCECPQGTCIDEDGKCRQDDEDDDKDGVTNEEDNCPDSENVQSVNLNKNDEYYGCDCDQIGPVMKKCPVSGCVGDKWVSYNDGEQECQDGILQPYTCSFEEQDFSPFCVDPLELALNPQLMTQSQGGSLSLASDKSGSSNNQGNQESSGQNRQNSDNQDQRQAFEAAGSDGLAKTNGFVSSGTTDAGSPPASGSANKPLLGINKQGVKSDYKKRVDWDWTKDWPTTNDAPGKNEISGGPSSGAGSPEGIKAALRRIHNADYQTYKMIFTYVSTVGHKDGGGECTGCGSIKVDYKAPLKVLDQIIVHEAAHSGQFCTVGMDGFTPAEVERIAVAIQIGSDSRRFVNTNIGRMHYNVMQEFPAQRSQDINYKGFQVRGYLARYLCGLNPDPMNCGSGEAWDRGNKIMFWDWINSLVNPVLAAQIPGDVINDAIKSATNGDYHYKGVMTGDFSWGVTYATKYPHQGQPPDDTRGPYDYGTYEHKPRNFFGAKAKEELGAIRPIKMASTMDKYTPCKSSPPPDLPPAFGCEGAPTIQLVGN